MDIDEAMRACCRLQSSDKLTDYLKKALSVVLQELGVLKKLRRPTRPNLVGGLRKCPSCNANVNITANAYICSFCGQKLDWSVIRK